MTEANGRNIGQLLCKDANISVCLTNSLTKTKFSFVPIFIDSNPTRIVNIACLDFALQHLKLDTSPLLQFIHAVRYIVCSDERVKFTLKFRCTCIFEKCLKGTLTKKVGNH